MDLFMPIYEYLCKKCKNSFEHLALNGKEQPACPSCASKSLTRLMSASSIVVNPASFACGINDNCSPDMCGKGECGGNMCGL